jgi:uncharacterized protein YecT (DUF1311 family)
MAMRLNGFGIIFMLVGMAPSIAEADCYDSPVQADLNACAGAELKIADAQLNAAYAAVRQRLSEDGQKRLRDAERAWIAYRDAECMFRSSGDDGGSAAVMVDVQCQAELTQERAKYLESVRTCEDGDLSCPR